MEYCKSCGEIVWPDTEETDICVFLRCPKCGRMISVVYKDEIPKP